MKRILFLMLLLTSSYLLSQALAPTNPKYLKFTYDDSGNQIERIYTTSLPKTAEEPLIDEKSFAEQFQETIKVYPNPTKGLFSIEWKKEFSQYIAQVEVLSADALIQRSPLNPSLNKLDVDLTVKPNGVYFVRFHFTDGSIISKKVIKL